MDQRYIAPTCQWQWSSLLFGQSLFSCCNQFPPPQRKSNKSCYFQVMRSPDVRYVAALNLLHFDVINLASYVIWSGYVLGDKHDCCSTPVYGMVKKCACSSAVGIRHLLAQI